ncbi:MAG: BON domain-containing protein [Vicinamibacterales bacterium]
MTRRLAALALVAAGACAGAVAPMAAQGQGDRDSRRIEAIRDALLRLPYYGVFDFLTFSYEKGTVVLGGYAYRATLPQDAERAVKRVPGVDAVKVEIATLPVSINDDDIRWRVFYAIYTNAFLSRYAPGGGLWGHTHPLGPLGAFSRFPGAQPVGNYPIHIVVQGGRVRLLGVVDNEADRTAAMLAARGVGGTFAVENELVVDQR